MKVVELRQYTLHPGQRDVLIALFEAHFIESQEACGIILIGQFRDLDRPDRFVWLRGFPDMDSRAKSLAAFYGGPVWKAHREAANATMIDSDNVLLLKPVSEFVLPERGTGARGESLIARICDADTAPKLERPPLAAFVTEPAPNSFPALPVREGENVFVWFAREGDAAPAGRFETLRLAPTARSRWR